MGGGGGRQQKECFSLPTQMLWLWQSAGGWMIISGYHWKEGRLVVLAGAPVRYERNRPESEGGAHHVAAPAGAPALQT